MRGDFSELERAITEVLSRGHDLSPEHYRRLCDANNAPDATGNAPQRLSFDTGEFVVVGEWG